MTCIVGVVDKGVVWIGADSLGSNGHYGMVEKLPKVFHCLDTPEAIIGFTHSFRMGQLLNFSAGLFDELSVSKGLIDYQYLVTNFIPNLQDLFYQGGFERNESGQREGGDFLLGYKDRLYRIQSDYSVLESEENYNACGSGQNFALGSLYTTEGSDLTAPERIHLALEAASKFCVSVAPPYYILNTKNQEIIKISDEIQIEQEEETQEEKIQPEVTD